GWTGACCAAAATTWARRRRRSATTCSARARGPPPARRGSGTEGARSMPAARRPGGSGAAPSRRLFTGVRRLRGGVVRGGTSLGARLGPFVHQRQQQQRQRRGREKATDHHGRERALRLGAD